MAYVPLKLDPSTPRSVGRFVRDSIEDLYFSDVHAMLRLPLPSAQITAGQNFAATQVLMSVIGGVAQTLFERDGEPGELFKASVELYFPWDQEPHLKVSRKGAASILYDVFRNPLTHNLGLFSERRKNHRYIVRKGYAVKIKRRLTENKTTGHTEAWLEQLECSSSRPDMGATLTLADDRRVLLVEGLYWCVRRMIQKLTADPERMGMAEKYLRPVT